MHFKDLFWHFLPNFLKMGLAPAQNSASQDGVDIPDEAIPPRHAASFLSVLGKMLALLAGTVFFAWAGNTRLICVFSAALLLYLLYQSQLYRQSFDGGQGGERIRPLAQSAILVAIAGFAKLIGDISIHFAAGAPRGLFDTASFVSSLRTFHWLGEFTIGLVFLPLAFVVFRWRIPGALLRPFQNLLRSCGILTFACNAYILAVGWWGSEAIHAAMEVFHITFQDSLWRNDLIITDSFWNASHQDAFCLLYNIQGKRWFYALVFMIPMLCLINVLWGLAMRIPTKADKSLLFSAYLLLVAYSVANRVGDIRQSPDCYVVDRRFTATHLDHNLAMCLKSHAGDSAAACYVGAESGWDGQRQTINGIIASRLSKRGKAQFEQENQEWDGREARYFSSLSRALAGRPDAFLVLARERWRIIRDRVLVQHREAVWKGVLSE